MGLNWEEVKVSAQNRSGINVWPYALVMWDELRSWLYARKSFLVDVVGYYSSVLKNKSTIFAYIVDGSQSSSERKTGKF